MKILGRKYILLFGRLYTDFSTTKSRLHNLYGASGFGYIIFQFIRGETASA